MGTRRPPVRAMCLAVPHAQRMRNTLRICARNVPCRAACATYVHAGTRKVPCRAPRVTCINARRLQRALPCRTRNVRPRRMTGARIAAGRHRYRSMQCHALRLSLCNLQTLLTACESFT